MIKELYKQIDKETAIMIKNTKIDCIRNKNITKSGCRVYDKGYIGIASTYGEPTEKTWKIAEDNLKLKIEYNCEPEKNRRRIRDTRKKIKKEVFIEKAEKLLEILQNEFSNFIFFNKLSLLERTTILANDCDLDYINYDNVIIYSLGIKTRNSSNLLDDTFLWIDKNFDINKISDMIRKRLNVYNKVMNIYDNCIMPVLIQFNNLESKFLDALNGENIGLKSSIFSDKIGQKVFNNSFTLYCDRTPNYELEPFFDLEGSTIEFDKYALIENGVINSGFTNKKCAKKYGMPITAGVLGNYDDVPMLNETRLKVKSSGKSINELAENEPVVLVTTMYGGNYTNTGEYASPVQTSYLVENGEIVGRLPEFNISNNIYSMFNEDYIGVCSEDYLTGISGVLINMKVKK